MHRGRARDIVYSAPLNVSRGGPERSLALIAVREPAATGLALSVATERLTHHYTPLLGLIQPEDTGIFIMSCNACALWGPF